MFIWCLLKGNFSSSGYIYRNKYFPASFSISKKKEELQWVEPLSGRSRIRTPIFYWVFIYSLNFFFLLWRCDPTRVMTSSFLRFLDHTQRRPTVGRTPLEKWSARRIDLYLTTHNTHNRQISMPPVGFEPTISAGERPQTYALDRAATGTGNTQT